MRKIILTVFALLPIIMLAQKHKPANREKVVNQQKIASGYISFKETKHDFGNFNENGGKVYHNFEFTNTGSKPLKIEEVIAGCGCTTTEYITTEVMPGEKGWVKAGFDPKGRQGALDKLITIKSNAANSVLTLNIVGYVIPAQNHFGDVYRYQYGNLAVNNQTFVFPKIPHTGYDSTNLYLYNLSNKEIQITKIEAPANITFTKYVNSMVPGSDMYMTIKVHPTVPVSFGPLKQEIKLYTNDDTLPVKTFTIQSTIVEDFTKLNEKQKKKAASAVLEPAVLDFGNVSLFSNPVKEIKITNTGKSTLYIHKIIRSCTCLTVEPSTTEIKKGKSAIIKVGIGLTNMAGPDTKKITFIVNDPKNPELNLDVNINVVP